MSGWAEDDVIHPDVSVARILYDELMEGRRSADDVASDPILAKSPSNTDIIIDQGSNSKTVVTVHGYGEDPTKIHQSRAYGKLVPAPRSCIGYVTISSSIR